MTADITIPAGTTWTPIGSAANPYTGVFDGDGHTVSGLTASITAAKYSPEAPFGLFGKTQGATIKNLKMSDTSLTGASYAGIGIYAVWLRRPRSADVRLIAVVQS